jgi:hypothetical protein
MAIKTVTSANVAEYVAERTAKGSVIASGEQQVAAADAAGPSTDGTPTPGNPVIKPGVTETVNTAPDPGNPTPSARSAEKTPVQSRIDELTRLRKEAEEFAEDEYVQRLRAESRIAELETQIKNLAPKPEAPKPVELKRPSPKDFTDQDAYDQAMEAYDVERDKRTREAAIAEGRQQAQQQAQNAVMAQRVEAAKKDIPDFVEVIEAAGKRTTVVPEHIKTAFFELDYGPQVAYELAKDPALEKRIFALSPAKALSELGKLELKYANKPTVVPTTPAAPTPETTRAPAPLQSVRSTGEGEVRADLTKPMPFSEYKAARMEKLRSERRRH